LIISAVVDRIEDGNAVLLANDILLEIRIPFEKGQCKRGDVFTLNIYKGNIEAQKIEVR